MGERQLLTALMALILGVAMAAQGPVYRERWGYMQLERLRDAVWQESKGRDAATRARIAELLVEPHGGVPFVPPARALAYLRGVEADCAFVLCATLGVYVLPEVVDPVATNEVCQQLNASLFLPFTVAEPGTLAFAVTVRDQGGVSVFETLVEKATSVVDLRRARAVVQVPCAELMDGTFDLEVRTRISGAEPRATDPVLRMSFHVLRGYQQRSEAAMTAVRDQIDGLAALQRDLLFGLAAEVSRAYQGEAFWGSSDAITDLHRLESALLNLAAERSVLHGMTGDVPVGVAAGAGTMRAVLRLAAGRFALPDDAVPEREPRPLLIFAGGLPSYDVTSHRPTAPGTTEPRALAARMQDLAIDDSWDVAFLESPGEGRSYSAALPMAIDALRDVYGTEKAPVVLVCEREAAAVVGLSIEKIRPHIDGLVLVGAGAMTASALERVADLPMRALLLHGYPSSLGLQRVFDYTAQQAAASEWKGDFKRLSPDTPAWLFGLPAMSAPIAAFAHSVAGS